MQEYLQIAEKIIFKEKLNFEIDDKELRFEFASCEEIFQCIDELLLEISSLISKLEWRIENE